MRYDLGNSVCVSSQVGCKMGCRFCASTLDGWSRNLIPGEILDQIYSISRDTGERVSHVVVMGTGEPMDNYDNVVRFIRMLTDENGLNISQRNVTVSTCGIVPKMYDLANENLAITLALSLHAVNDEKRRTIMPVAERYSIAELMDVCRNYFDVTGRRITFEYSLIAGVNDSKEDSDALARLADGVMAHVNLIPVNPIKERDFVQPTRAAAVSFKYRLEKKGISVTIRREMGADIVKTEYPGTSGGIKMAIDACMRPVIVEESPLPANEAGTLKTVEDAMAAGAAGVFLGSRIWAEKDPVAVGRKVREIVYR